MFQVEETKANISDVSPPMNPSPFVERALEGMRLATVEPQRAKDGATALLAEAERLGDRLGIAWSRCAQATADFGLGYLSDAITGFHEALRLARAENDQRLAGYCLHHLGRCYFNRSEYLRSLEYSYEAVAVRQKLPHNPELTASIGALGAIHGMLGNMSEAAECLTEALEIARRTGDRLAEAINLGNIGLLQLKIDAQNDEILTLLSRSAAIAEEIGDTRLLVSSLTSWADALTRRGDLEEAERRSLEAVQRIETINAPRLRINAWLQIAALYIQQERWNEAVAALQRAETEADIGRIAAVTPRLPMTWGQYYQARSEWDRAYHYYCIARQSAEALGEKEVAATLERALADTSEAKGDLARALAHFRAHHEQHIALEKKSVQNLLLTQQAKTTVEKALREAEMARKEAELARLRNVELAEANRQKDRLLHQLQQQANKLARLAVEDPLTGLYNRRYLMEYLEGELRRAREQNVPLTVVMGDLDNFKMVNDRFSHAVGDEVLKATAQILLFSCRPGDVVARYGGEEFVAVLPDTDAVGAEILCERIRQGIESYRWQEFHPELRVTISLGIADEPFEQTDRLLAMADRRLYEAKHEGKNRTISTFTERVPDVMPEDAMPFSSGRVPRLPYSPFSAG